MQRIKLNINLIKIVFCLFFIITNTILVYLIVKPFILSFTWAVLIVVFTWPFIIKLQKIFWGKKYLAIILIIILLFLFFIIPIFLIIANLTEDGVHLINLLFLDVIYIPELYWLNSIPIIGNKLYIIYHKASLTSLSSLFSIIQPYISKTTGFFVTQASYVGKFMIQLFLILLFTTIMYCRGEEINIKIIRFANKISKKNGKKIIYLIVKLIRSVVLSLLITATIQGTLSGIGIMIVGIPYATIIIIIMIFFCLLQIGPLPILIPSIIWLYWNNDSLCGTILLLWSIFVAIIDNIIKPIIIHKKDDLPLIIIFFGTIGGFLSFGIIGVFIGPIILAISYHLIINLLNNKKNKYSMVNLKKLPKNKKN